MSFASFPSHLASATNSALEICPRLSLICASLRRGWCSWRSRRPRIRPRPGSWKREKRESFRGTSQAAKKWQVNETIYVVVALEKEIPLGLPALRYYQWRYVDPDNLRLQLYVTSLSLNILNHICDEPLKTPKIVHTKSCEEAPRKPAHGASQSLDDPEKVLGQGHLAGELGPGMRVSEDRVTYEQRSPSAIIGRRGILSSILHLFHSFTHSEILPNAFFCILGSCLRFSYLRFKEQSWHLRGNKCHREPYTC